MEPLNAAVLAIIPEKRPNSADPLARRYTCDSSPGEGVAAGEMQPLPGDDVLLRQPRLRRASCWGRRAGRDFQGWKAGDECFTAGKIQQDQMVPVNYGRLW